MIGLLCDGFGLVWSVLGVCVFLYFGGYGVRFGGSLLVSGGKVWAYLRLDIWDCLCRVWGVVGVRILS